ncbi:MAG: DUF356 domain-containing protein [Methanobrevibacter sp.]|jgi:hypothetical protein|nr:DUF356 domain-containing protein [Candidatus Methanovirga basalitermitum]
MALILIRGENNSKLLNAIADIERHAKLRLISKPKIISAAIADDIVEKILKVPLRSRSKVATSFFVKEDITLSIMQVKTIHPPAHVIVVSDEYEEYEQLDVILDECPDLRGYNSKPANSDQHKNKYKNNHYNDSNNRYNNNHNNSNNRYNKQNNNKHNSNDDNLSQPTQLRDYKKDYLSTK